MTWQALSEARPRTGQAVKYRLRPNGVQVQATYDPEQPAWMLEDGHQQTARAHHQWTPDPAIENRTCLGCGKPLERKMYRGKLETERQFRARQCCDQVCNGRRKRTVTAPDTKTCPRCGKRYHHQTQPRGRQMTNTNPACTCSWPTSHYPTPTFGIDPDCPRHGTEAVLQLADQQLERDTRQGREERP